MSVCFDNRERFNLRVAVRMRRLPLRNRWPRSGHALKSDTVRAWHSLASLNPDTRCVVPQPHDLAGVSPLREEERRKADARRTPPGTHRMFRRHGFGLFEPM